MKQNFLNFLKKQCKYFFIFNFTTNSLQKIINRRCQKEKNLTLQKSKYVCINDEHFRKL